MWADKSKDYLTCTLCPNACKLGDDGFGRCKARRADMSNGIYLDAYGRLTHISVEPISKKPFKHFGDLLTLSIGSYGCNMSCIYCENHEYSQNFKLSESAIFSPVAIVNLAKANNCQTVCMSFTEPTIHYEYMADLSEATRKEGLKFIIKTNAYVEQAPWFKICEMVDAANIDYKGARNYRFCGVEDGSCIIKRIREMVEAPTKPHIEISIPLFAIDKNESLLSSYMEFVEEISKFTKEVPIHIFEINPAYRVINFPAVSKEAFAEVEQLFRANFKNVYTY